MIKSKANKELTVGPAQEIKSKISNQPGQSQN